MGQVILVTCGEGQFLKTLSLKRQALGSKVDQQLPQVASEQTAYVPYLQPSVLGTRKATLIYNVPDRTLQMPKLSMYCNNCRSRKAKCSPRICRTG